MPLTCFKGTIMFHLKQRPPGMPRKRKKPASVVDIPIRHTPAAEQQVEQPYLEQLNPGKFEQSIPLKFVLSLFRKTYIKQLSSASLSLIEFSIFKLQ